MRFENDWLMRKVCKPIAEIQQFYRSTPAEIEHRIRVTKPLDEYELILPKIRWHKNLDPSEDVAKLNIWRDLKERGIISERTYGAGAGVDIDTERKHIVEEKKYKEDHPEEYGIPPQQQTAPGMPGAPGGRPPMKSPVPPAAPPAADHAPAYRRDNPYISKRSSEIALEAIEERFDEMSMKIKGSKGRMINADDALEAVAEVHEGMELVSKDQLPEELPLSSAKLLTGL